MKRERIDSILRSLLVAGNIVTVSFDENERHSQRVKPLCSKNRNRDNKE